MDKTKEIPEAWEQKQIDREDVLGAKLCARDHWSQRRAEVDQRFALKWYIMALPLFKRCLAKWVMNDWFEEENRNSIHVLNSEGSFSYPDISLKD